MKTNLLTISVATAALCIAASSFGQAAGPKGGPPQAGPGGQQGGRMRMGGGQRMQKVREEIFAKLNLTAAQKTKVKALNDKQAAKIKSLMDGMQKPGADRTKTMDAFKASRADYEKALAGILTKDQKKKYDGLVKEAREKFRAQRGTGKGQNPK